MKWLLFIIPPSGGKCQNNSIAVAGLCRCVVDKVESLADGRAIIFEINACVTINRNWIDQNEKPHTKWNAINVGSRDPRIAYALIMKIFMIIYSFFFSFV